MFAVVQLHDLRINMRFQSTIVIWQVRKSVLLPGDQAAQWCYQLGAASRRENTRESSLIQYLGFTTEADYKHDCYNQLL